MKKGKREKECLFSMLSQVLFFFARGKKNKQQQFLLNLKEKNIYWF